MSNEKNNLASLREALALSPDNVPLLKMFAQACLDQWSLPEARESFEKILRLNAQDWESKLGLARVLFKMGNLSEATVRAEAVAAEHPTCAAAWVLLSQLSRQEGNLEQSRKFSARARELDPHLANDKIESSQPPRPEPPATPTSQEKVFNMEQGWKAGLELSGPTGEEPSLEDSLNEILENPTLAFADVGGMQSVKEEIRMKIIYPRQNPELFKAYGKKMGGGVLLYGPPGCGKTLVSRATAGEIKAHFISIGLHQILDMYIGNSEKNLHDIFELARSHKPSVLFVDEIDALAANRNDLKQSAARTLINQFLAELDGETNANDGVLVLGATNAPWHIDPAFRRPGRFDRIIFVPTPDEAARVDIIKILAKDKPLQQLDALALAKKTDNFSGADLKSVFDVAVEHSLARAMRENRVIPLTTEDLFRAAKTIVPSSRAWFESAKNYALYANQSGLYDPILHYLGIKK